MTLLRCLCLMAALLPGMAHNATAQTFSVAGAVLMPGSYPWHSDARLHDATVAGQVRADAWSLGAALLRQSAQEPQQRLKAGVLFDLQVNRLHARTENNQPLAELVNRLAEQVSAMPVTGRITAQLAPFQLLLPQHNRPLEPGDKLIYPTRPAQIRVMGAVTTDCELTYDAALELKHYLRQCPPHPSTDRDHVYLIQPDGRVQQIGIAHWNQQQASLAVGAIIYRPLKLSHIQPETAELNTDMATLLATQYPLGGHFSE